MLRRAAAAATVLLGIFHGWLFLGQLWDGRALEPAQAARWALAAGLVAALLDLRRRGEAVIAGRRAAAVWLVAALLHAPGALERTGDLSGGDWSLVATVVATAGTAAVVGLALARRAPGRARLVATAPPLVDRVAARALRWRAVLVLAPRPPPLPAA
jgi:hypothetical protein